MTEADEPPAPYIDGPFGPAEFVLSLPTASVTAMYQARCGFDARPFFKGAAAIHLYRSQQTGIEFWRPAHVAGDEDFYRGLSAVWSEYYKDWRWEYEIVHRYLRGGDRVLEIGCGRGYFLRSVEGRASHAKGLEFNQEAIATKVTRWEIEAATIERTAELEAGSYGLVCGFQVLEHVVDPAAFMRSAAAALAPGGILALSVPNHAHSAFANREDAFDLPPHHMTHFSRECFGKIAALLGIRLKAVHLEPVRRHQLVSSSGGSLASEATRVVKNTAKSLLNRWYHGNEPGPSMLAIFER